MTLRPVTLHVFCSIRGGVGKSSLATLAAKLLALRGRIPLLIDADMTGTSLADGLRLCAPVPVIEDGKANLSEEPTEVVDTVEETRSKMRDRPHVEPGMAPFPPLFLNDLLARETEPRVRNAIWKHEQTDGVLYLPSSGLWEDVKDSLAWLSGPELFAWIHRFATLLEDLTTQMPTVTDILVDMPTGVWGLGHEMLLFLLAIEQGEMPDGYPNWQECGIRWSVNPFLVSSQDRNDYLSASKFVAQQVTRPLRFELLINPMVAGMEALRQEVERELGPQFSNLGLGADVRGVPLLQQSLGALFRSGDVSMSALESETDVDRLWTTLRLGSHESPGAAG